ncbi:MAG: hypothetical protein WCT14_18685, partial [Treponemataceae bacterium]
LPQPSRIIKIEEIATQEEIEKALQSRKVEGKHVIPVPSFEVKRNYPTIFHDAIKVFLKRGTPVPISGAPRIYEKAVVRPEYSKRVPVTISEEALSQMVIHGVDEFNKDFAIKKVVVKAADAGYRVVITIDVPYGTELSGNIQELQKYLINSIERYTGIMIEEVNIIIDRIAQS